MKTGAKKQDQEKVVIDDLSQTDKSQSKASSVEDFKTNTLKELHRLLEGAVKDEDYERAAKIRDEISKRT